MNMRNFKSIVCKVCFVQLKACYLSIDDAYFRPSKDKTWGYRLKPVCVVCWAHRQCIHPLAGKTRKAATFPPSLTARPTSSPWYPSAQLNNSTHPGKNLFVIINIKVDLGECNIKLCHSLGKFLEFIFREKVSDKSILVNKNPFDPFWHPPSNRVLSAKKLT